MDYLHVRNVILGDIMTSHTGSKYARRVGIVSVLENSPVKGLPGVKERPGDNDFDLLRNEGT